MITIHRRRALALLFAAVPGFAAAQGLQTGPELLRGGQYLVQPNRADKAYDPNEVQRAAILGTDAVRDGQNTAGGHNLAGAAVYDEVPDREDITELRKESEFAALPIIAISANAMPAERDRVLELGATDFVTKPFMKDELYRKIMLALNLPVLTRQPVAATLAPKPQASAPQAARRWSRLLFRLPVLFVHVNLER